MLADPESPAERSSAGDQADVALGLLGGFRLLKRDQVVEVRHGGKTERLLTSLGLRADYGMERDELLALLWPASDEALAAQSLHTLTHVLRRTLAGTLGGHAPIIRRGGRLCLNVENGIAVDVAEFESAAATGDRLGRAGDDRASAAAYHAAVDLYRGDLVIGSDV